MRCTRTVPWVPLPLGFSSLQWDLVIHSLSTQLSSWRLSQLVVISCINCSVLFLVGFHWPLRSLQGKQALAVCLCLVYFNTEHVGLNSENPMAVTAWTSVDIFPLWCMLTPFHQASSYHLPWDDRAETETDWECCQEEKGQYAFTKASWESKKVMKTNIGGANCRKQRQREGHRALAFCWVWD